MLPGVAVMLEPSLFTGMALFGAAGEAHADKASASAIENNKLFFTVIPLKSVGMAVEYTDFPSVQTAQFDGARNRQFCLSGPGDRNGRIFQRLFDFRG